MKLIVFGEELDSSQEHEIIRHTQFGMKVTIEYGDEAPEGWCDEVRRNITEVHHLYDKTRLASIDVSDEFRRKEASTAFESDIHQQGGTQRVHYLSKVIVEHDTELAEDVYESNRYDDLCKEGKTAC